MITTFGVTVAVLAAPTYNPRGSSDGIAIPLIKHCSSLVNTKKTINVDSLEYHDASCSGKFIRSMNSFERSTKTSDPSVVKPDQSLRNRGTGVDLTNHANALWYGTILIGTPAKSFTVQFDTGSSDLFIPASTGDEDCRSHSNLWDPASSQYAKELGRSFGMMFTDSSFVGGEQYTDNVTIAGFTADIQTIGAATTYSSDMAASVFAPDGILGLAFPSRSTYPASPLFHTLFDEGKLPQPVFSLKLTASGGELYVGGMNEALYVESSLEFTSITNSGLWELVIDNIQVNDKIVLTDVLAIVDTGANWIYGDASRVLALHQAYGGKAFGDASGYYTFPCSSFPSVTFTIGGRPYLIPAYVLNYGRPQPGSRDCFSGIVSTNMHSDDPWTIGTLFLQRFYTVFDFGSSPPRVGFAKLARMPVT